MQGIIFGWECHMSQIILFCSGILMNRMSNFTYLGKRINEAFYQNQAIVNTFRESPGVGGGGLE